MSLFILPKSERLLELDALRGLAALLVVFFHFTWGIGVPGFTFVYGNTGVDLFFIISGFVIFMSLHNSNGIKEFVINRICRLYPTYWASVSFSYILVNLYYHYHTVDFEKLVWSDYLINLTMLQFYFNVPNVDQPYWTMIIELIFYIVMGGLFYFKTFPHIFHLGIMACIMVVTMANFLPAPICAALFKWMPFFTYLPLFFSGIVFYFLYYKKQNPKVLYLGLLVVYFSQLGLFEQTGRGIFLSFFQYATMVFLFFFVFILFVNGKLKFIVNRFTVFMGRISFALYLTHQFISVNILLPFLVNTLGLNFWLSSCLIILPCIILVATLLTYYVEKPLGSKMKLKLLLITGLNTKETNLLKKNRQLL